MFFSWVMNDSLVLFLAAAYMSNPCHIELILSEKEESVKKEVNKSYTVS